MVWDVCSWRDMGPLIRLETTLTGDRYLIILPDHLHSFIFIMHSDGLGQFQQDNATPHASIVATKWLQEHFYDFRHFHGHLNSQRRTLLNISWMPCYMLFVEKRSPPPRTPMDLWTALQDSWCELPPGYLQTLIESMSRRVAALLRAGGALHDISQVYQFFWLLSVYDLINTYSDNKQAHKIDISLFYQTKVSQIL
ncbi:hypothetical protein AVEN_38300-1 [Araneus ventricosus]|uniref:Uncharacterized protein n=1 Tax=Araneus ventricosus TaxID=182803 RepID=A0A4Y2RNQ7_ARAVE|nr:hypothetical protein AVEN_38300-1 [Araneus ventricosus]